MKMLYSRCKAFTATVQGWSELYFSRRCGYGPAHLYGIVAVVLLTLMMSTERQAQAQTPSWLSGAVIYCANDEIFSTSGISGITAQLPRLKSLGVNTIWLMPIYPRGVACTVDGISHPSYDSPYCIENLEGIDPTFGTPAQLTTLVNSVHNDGMKIILDMPINCTSWNNPLITSNPAYYWHSDGNVNNVASIVDGWGNDPDVAELDLYTNAYGAQTYITNVCKYWQSTYGFDGFRFDAADDPYGSGRSLQQSFAQTLYSDMKAVNPNFLDLGEEEDPALALNPYGLDYGWNMYSYGIVDAFTETNNASTLSYQWDYPYTNSYASPAGMLHMNVQDDWDYARDVNVLGGASQALAAAVWDFTITGVPLMYNGMEVGNNTGGVNSHTQINWNGGGAAEFTAFYRQLLSLRNNSNGALQQGSTTFETNSSPAVIAYDRSGGGQQYFIEINTNGNTVSGTVSVPSGVTWRDVTPAGSPGGESHELPNTGDFSLQPYDFAVFEQLTGLAGSLAGTETAVTSPAAFNLTTTGTTDWAAWGLDGTDHDITGNSEIGTLYTYAGGSLNGFTSNYLGSTWTNGTPDVSETNETDGYYNNAGVGDGFSFQVPASTTTQHVTVYVGGYESAGTLTAYLSDGSAATYTNSSLSSATASYYGYYTLTYKSSYANQYLTVNWVQKSGNGNVTIFGAALH